jgi:hypothetical protein
MVMLRGWARVSAWRFASLLGEVLGGQVDRALVAAGAVDVTAQGLVERCEVGAGEAAGVAMLVWHRNAMSFMHPRTLRSAVVAIVTRPAGRWGRWRLAGFHGAVPVRSGG